MPVRVAVIDFGMGNIGSICKMLRVVGADPVVTSDPRQLAAADKLVLPGVGHFDRAMQNLSAASLVDELKELVQAQQKDILGVCLGMQLLCCASEEGAQPGLGFVNAHVRRFEGGNGLKVPHMGWSHLEITRPSTLLAQLDGESRFYFVHSYFVDCVEQRDVLAVSNYGHSFVSAFERGNVKGVQFHPEKSHRFGMQVFRNFVAPE